LAHNLALLELLGRSLLNKPLLSIVADENMPMVDEMFEGLATISKVDGRTLTAKQLVAADILLVRSVTKVDEALLAGSRVKFVGSATIGTDHIDLDYLRQQNIAFSSAPGCNAQAVVEYDICCLSLLLNEKSEKLQDKSVAIIGVGNVGQRLADRLKKIGVKKIYLNDPPRAIKESGFSDLDECLNNADIVAMHTPLVTTGAHPTHHLIKLKELNKLKENAILLNAGRGAAIKGDDLLSFLQQRDDVKTVLDVWEHEPQVDVNLAEKINIATQHIAGHSLEGKVRGTFMLKQALCKWLQSDVKESLEHYLPKPAIENINVNNDVKDLAIMALMYDPFKDDRRFRASLVLENQAKQFDLLRKNYPIRREFNSLKITGELSDQRRQEIKQLGFNVIS